MKLSSLTTKLKTRLRKALVVTATVLTAVAGANFTALPANANLAYDFTSWTFTPCGQTGRLGPTLAMCQTAYAGSTFAADSNYFHVDSQGQQWWKPPVAGIYRFEVAGAAGGGTNGGRGVVFQEQIQLTTTNWTCIAIGQKGIAATKSPDTGGGGGHTYVGSNPSNTSGNCANGASVHAAGGGGGGNTPGKDANPDLSAGSLSNPGLSGTGRGAGVAIAGSDTGRGGPLTGSSSRSGSIGTNTGAYIGGVINATSAGNWGMNGTAQGGTFGLGLGGDGGFPSGGASCDCVPGGGGGGGGGGYSPGGGGGYDADGTGGGGGGGGSKLTGDLSSAYTGFNLGSINTGDGYLKISYQATTSAVFGLYTLPNTQPYVGGTYTAPTALSFSATDPGATSVWKWQLLKAPGTYPGGSPDIVDIPGTTATTLVVPAAASGYRIRPVQVVTTSNGDLFYFSGPSSVYISGSHTITGTPPNTFRGDTGYTFTFGLTGDFGSTGTSGWARASGTLPPGVGLGSNGLFSGTPSTAGTYNFVVSHNNGYETTTKDISVTISPSVTFTSATSKACVWETSCSHQVVATPPAGETLTYSIDSGTVPTGLTFDPATALFSGTFAANSVFNVWVKALASNGAYGIQKIFFSTGAKTQQGYFGAINFTTATWNAASPPTTSVTWTKNTPSPTQTILTIKTADICSGPSGSVTSPITLTALAKGNCIFELAADGDATYNSVSSGNKTWNIIGTPQAAVTLAQAAGSLNWVDNNTTITVQGAGGTGTGAYVYGTSSLATVCVVDPTTGVVTWLTSSGCTVTAYRLADPVYAQSSTVSVAFTPVNKAQVTPVTVTSDVSSVQFSAGGKFNVAGSGGDFAPGSLPSYFFTSLTTTVCNPQAQTSQINILNAGTCQIVARAKATGAWLAGTVDGAATSFNIIGTSQAALSLVANSGNAITYTANGTINYVVSGGSGTGGWTVANDPSTASICTSSGTSTSNSLTMKGAGTCLINVTKASQGGFYAATQQFSIAIGKATQSVISMIFSPTALTYNPTTPATFTVSASGGSTTSGFVFSIDPSATSICSITGTTVTALGAGSCIVLGYRSGNANFADSPTLSKTMAISKSIQASVTITANRTTLTGSDTDPLVITGAGGSGTGAYIYATSTSTICSIDSATGVVTPKLNGNCSITATRAADANFLVSTNSAILNITVTKLAQASFVASSTTTSTTYGAGTFTVSATGGSGTGSVTFASSNTAICTVVSTTGVTTIVTPGSCVITATKAADTNYLVATSSVTITIAKANQATFTATLTNATATVGQVGVYAGGNGGTTTNGLDFSANDASICVANGGGMISTYSPGSCVITVTRPGNTYYNDISDTITLQVNKATQATFNLTTSRASGSYLDGASYSVSSSGGSGAGAVSYASNSASVCSVDSATGVVTILSAGTCSITATKSGGTNYIDATKTVTISIAKSSQPTLVVSVDDAAPAYTTNPMATVQVSYTGGSSTGAVTYSTSTSAVCSVDATGLVTDITKGKCIVTVTVAADTNYNAASGTVTIRFGKVDQAAVTVATSRASVVYASGSSVTVSLTGGSGTGSVSFATSSANCSVNASSGVVTYTGAGSCVVVATKAGDIDYAEASGSVTITVTKANQAALTASSSSANTTYGSATVITVSTTGGSGTGAVTFSSNTAGVCSVDSTTGEVTILTAGTCTIAASKASDANYNSISNTASVVVAKASQSALTLAPSQASAVFGDGSTITVSVTGGSGTGAVTYLSNSTSICTVNSSTGAVTAVSAGTCSITATKAADVNYSVTTDGETFTIAKANQAALSASGSQNITHSVAKTTAQITVSGGSGTGTVSYAVDASSTGVCTVSAGGLVTELHAGTCLINITKAGDANYNAATMSFTITIAKANQAALTVSGNQNITYNATTTATSQLTVSGGSGTGSVTYSINGSTVCGVSGQGLVTALTGGSCVITITKAGDGDFNERTATYTVTIAKAAQAALIVRTAATLTYNPSTPETTTVSVTTGGSGTGAITFSTTSTACSIIGSTVTALSAGACLIKADKATDSRYLAATADYTIIIGKAAQTALSATASKTSLKVNDANDGTATVTLTGGSGTGGTSWFVDPSTTGVCSVNFSVTPAVVTALAGGTCLVNITKAGDSNYLETATSVSFTIVKNAQAALTVSSTKNTAMKGETATLSATGGSTAGNLSYSVVTGATVCSISGTTVTFIGAGSCTVKATRAGDASFDAVDSATITLSATKAEQSQLVVTQTAGMLANVAIGGKSATSWNLSGGDGNGALSVSNVTGCYATIVGNVLTASAGAASGSCVIDVAKDANENFNATTYRVSLSVFDLPSAAVIDTPVLNLTNGPNGVGVDVPFTPSNSGTFIAPVTGYQLQTKSGSNWVNADNGFATGATATKVSISVTPWTSIFVRVAAVSPYEADNGTSRIWSTYGGATAQAFSVPGIINSLSLTTVSAKSPETITVTGAGYSQSATPTVEFTAAAPIFQINGVNTATITLPASVKSATQLTFKYPGALLPSGAKTLAASVKVIGASSMKSNGAAMTLTQEEESLDLGLDLGGGKFAPKVGTVYSGSFTWAFNTANGSKIFIVPTCIAFKTVKGVKTCTKTVMKDSASCTISQSFPVNKAAVRRMVTFKVPCQLNVTGKLAVLAATPIDIVAKATFNRTYPKTNLAYVLVKGKKTKPLLPTKATYIYLLGNKQLVKK